MSRFILSLSAAVLGLALVGTAQAGGRGGYHGGSHYSGGYHLPDDAPPALQQALGMLVQIARVWQSRAMTAGVRSISHRESRVQFFDIFQELGKMGAPGPFGMASGMISSLLYKYTRFYA